mgnify:FL=1
MKSIPSEYRPLSPWAYFGYGILFNIPVIGFILLIIFSLDNSNINRKNYARSYWCIYILVIIFIIVLTVLGTSVTEIIDSSVTNV